MAKGTPAAEWLAEALTEKFRDASPWSHNKFSVLPGRKFDKIVQSSDPEYSSGQSVHCFVNRETGEVYKAATWRAPAAHARYADPQSALEAATINGGYLYGTAQTADRGFIA